MLRILDRAVSGLLWVLGLCLLAMIALTMVNVIGRYVFSRALLWADEVAVFGMIALTWIGAVVSGWRGTEIRMDILANLMPPAVQRWLGAVQQAAIAVLCAWVAWQSLTFITRAFRFGMRSDASGTPMWAMHALIPASLTLIAAIAALRCLRLLMGHGESLQPAAPVPAKETP